jgi:MoaA/NifB/PqqE/SkfB family radical SAM enzyme
MADLVRSPRNKIVPAPVPRDFLSTIGIGSLAYVGEETCDEPPGRSLYLAYEVGEACQLQCRHCIYHRPRSSTPRPGDVAFDALRRALHEGLDPQWVSVAGKEPTLFPERLLEVASLVRRPGRTVIVMTNGLKLRGSLLDELSEVVDYFDVSVDGDERAHDWMRGRGTFATTWASIEEVLRRTDRRVGLIATAVNATLDDGRRQVDAIGGLLRYLEKTVGAHARLSLTVSLYYGAPNDPLRLGEEEITDLVTRLAESPVSTRVLYTTHYAHTWAAVAQRLGWTNRRVTFDRASGIPFVQEGALRVMLLSLTRTQQLVVRVSNDGHVFLGCNHLVLGDDAPRFRLGGLDSTPLASLVERAAREDPSLSLMRDLGGMPEDCLRCPDFGVCRGGDRLSGLFFTGHPADPYCPKIAWN